MSNNYYLILNPSDVDSSNVQKIHIGKSNNSHVRGVGSVYGMSTFSGAHFPNVKAWIDFIRYNANSSRIEDEYGHVMDNEAFISSYLNQEVNASASQIQWLRNNGSEIVEEPEVAPVEDVHWIDKATGKLFYNGVFF